MDQNPADPQSWNLYTYARNNPLRYVDLNGMEAVSKEDCEKDQNCVSVKLNVILDKNASLYDRNGKLLPEYQKKLDAQVAQAQSDYGEFNIHLEVAVVQGEVTNTDKGLTITGELDASAINVAVTDSNTMGLDNRGKSGLAGPIAATFLNMPQARSNTLPHELAHHFAGDTASLLRGVPVMGSAVNFYMDRRNDLVRAFPGPRPVAYPGFAPNWGMFNRGARRFAMR